MNRREFEKRMNEENLGKGHYVIELDKISHTQYTIGCCYDNGQWKYYQTGERQDIRILKVFQNEDDAFDYFYQVILFQNKLDNQ